MREKPETYDGFNMHIETNFGSLCAAWVLFNLHKSVVFLRYANCIYFQICKFIARKRERDWDVTGYTMDWNAYGRMDGRTQDANGHWNIITSLWKSSSLTLCFYSLFSLDNNVLLEAHEVAPSVWNLIVRIMHQLPLKCAQFYFSSSSSLYLCTPPPPTPPARTVWWLHMEMIIILDLSKGIPTVNFPKEINCVFYFPSLERTLF